MSPRKLTTSAALGISTAAMGTLLLGAPAAYADAATAMPAQIASAAAADRLTVETSNGWEAVVGPASSVNEVRDLSKDLGIGTVSLYTGNDETGRAILIFTGNNDSPVGFKVHGDTFTSVDNETDQAWYVFDDSHKLDESVAAGTAENVNPVDLTIDNTIKFQFNLFGISSLYA